MRVATFGLTVVVLGGLMSGCGDHEPASSPPSSPSERVRALHEPSADPGGIHDAELPPVGPWTELRCAGDWHALPRTVHRPTAELLRGQGVWAVAGRVGALGSLRHFGNIVDAVRVPQWSEPRSTRELSEPEWWVPSRDVVLLVDPGIPEPPMVFEYRASGELCPLWVWSLPGSGGVMGQAVRLRETLDGDALVVDGVFDGLAASAERTLVRWRGDHLEVQHHSQVIY